MSGLDYMEIDFDRWAESYFKCNPVDMEAVKEAYIVGHSMGYGQARAEEKWARAEERRLSGGDNAY